VPGLDQIQWVTSKVHFEAKTVLS